MKTLALIGVGRWGGVIEKTLKNIEGAKLKYICARSSEHLKPYASSYETETDYRKLLFKKDIDAVLVVTPPSTHATVAIPFLRKGIPVFIEKPLAHTLKDALRIERAAVRHGAFVSVGHIHLYNPAYLAAKEAIGKNGALRAVYGESGNNGPFREDVSVLWDWAPHDLSMILDLTGEMPSSVAASALSVLRPGTKLYDAVWLSLSFPSGLGAFIRVSWLQPLKEKRMIFVGETDSVVFDDVLTEKKVMVYKGAGPRVLKGEIEREEPTVEYPTYSAERPLTKELRAFLEAIDKNIATETPLSQGISVVRILDAAERSIAKGGKRVFL